MELNIYQQSAIRGLLSRGFYEAAYKELKLNWHPVDTNLSIEKIVEKSDDKYIEDVRLLYSLNQQAIFDHLESEQCAMFLRHIQYEFQRCSIRNGYLDLLRQVVEQSVHKGYMFVDQLSKEIKADINKKNGINEKVEKADE